jgi:hypothetical protein
MKMNSTHSSIGFLMEQDALFIKLLLGFLMISISLVAIFGNMLVILAMMRNPSLRTVKH